MATYFMGMQRRTIFLWTFNERIFLFSFNIFMDTSMSRFFCFPASSMNVAYNLKFIISAAYIAFIFISILLWDLKRLVDVGAAHFQTIHLMILHFITLCQSRAGEKRSSNNNNNKICCGVGSSD